MQDLNDKVTGGTLTAEEWNEVPSEIQNVIEGLGIVLSGGDLDQLGKGIAGYVANGTFYTDSGIADAYVLTQVGSKQAPTAYTDGFEINFLASNPNTGASTVNVAGLGVKNIKLAGGSDPAAGDITSRSSAVFDLANDWFELSAAAGATVTSTGSNANGTFRIWSDGTIEQWANGIVVSSGNNLITFPTAFITQVDAVIGVGANTTVGAFSFHVRNDQISLTQFGFQPNANSLLNFYAKGI